MLTGYRAMRAKERELVTGLTSEELCDKYAAVY
jgi:hypothetical protein